VSLISNPVVLRMIALLAVALLAFFAGRLAIRHLRSSLSEEVAPSTAAPSPESFPLQTYNAVIQQLKQQKHELESEQQAERRRARTSENISAAVLSNLPCGVLFFTPNGLLRQSNAAARKILGLASPTGMSMAEVFREATASNSASVAQQLSESARAKSVPRMFEARYVSPLAEERWLEITAAPVNSTDGEVLGMACLINDKTDMTRMRRRQEEHGEISAEMALALRNSLATISGYAQQLAAARDSDLARHLAADVAAEAAHLDRTIGSFLASRNSSTALAMAKSQ
jgi:PAS domain S-box-containing protein